MRTLASSTASAGQLTASTRLVRRDAAKRRTGWLLVLTSSGQLELVMIDRVGGKSPRTVFSANWLLYIDSESLAALYQQAADEVSRCDVRDLLDLAAHERQSCGSTSRDT